MFKSKMAVLIALTTAMLANAEVKSYADDEVIVTGDYYYKGKVEVEVVFHPATLNVNVFDYDDMYNHIYKTMNANITPRELANTIKKLCKELKARQMVKCS